MGRTHTETERAELCEITEGETVSVRYSSNRSTSMVEREGVVESVSESSSGVITVRTEGFRLRFLPASGSTVVESLPHRNRLDNGETVVVERVVEVVDEDSDGVSVEEAFELLAPEEDDEDDVEEESNSHAARIEAQLRMAEEEDLDGSESEVEDDEEDPVAELLDRDDEVGTLPDFDEFRSGGDGEPVTDGGRPVGPFDGFEAALDRLSVTVNPGATIEREEESLDVEIVSLSPVDESLDLAYASDMAEAGLRRVARFEAVDRALTGVLGETAEGDVVELRIRDGLRMTPVEVPSYPPVEVEEDGSEGFRSARDVRDEEPVADGGIIVAGDGGEVLDDSSDRKAQGDRESRSGMSDYRERITAREADVIDGLSEGSLTEKQAVAYALREVFGRTREETAEVMGMSTSSVDTHRARGAAKVEEARSTVEALDDDPELVTDGGRDSLRFEALGLDVEDDEARELSNKVFQILRDAGHEAEGVAPVLREDVDDDRHPETREHTPSTAWLDQVEAAGGSEAVVRGDELYRVTVERVELRDGESSDGRGGVRPVPDDVSPTPEDDDEDDDGDLVTDGYGREEPRRPPVAESRSRLVDSTADRVYDSIEFGDVDREEALGALMEVVDEIQSGTPSLKRFEDLEAGEEL